jgi:hypothetical protein
VEELARVWNGHGGVPWLRRPKIIYLSYSLFISPYVSQENSF